MSPTRQMILERAGELFYREGFNNTGMEEITEVCGIRKPSLYYHFGSKNELGLAYIEHRADALFEMLTALLDRSKSFGGYLRSWANAYIVLARRGEFSGCAFTAFASELDSAERQYFEERLKRVEKEWLSFQENAFHRFNPDAAGAAAMARRILITHTGCVMLFRASRDMRHLRELRSAFAEIARQ